MAAVGAGTTGFYTGSHIFKKPQLARSSRHKYKAVFSPTALKQTLNEQKIHEYEYLTMRRRAFWKRLAIILVVVLAAEALLLLSLVVYERIIHTCMNNVTKQESLLLDIN